jgi:S1-C subfamily serine protease
MKLGIPSAIVVGVSLLVAIPHRSHGQLDPALQESTVRIICPGPAENGAKGFKVIQLTLASGEIAHGVNYSSGTGFVVTDDGVIVTNNHVVAPEPLKDTPSPLVMVMQKIGNQYILHKSTVLWQNPNADVAVIQAPSLKAKPFPIVFDETKSTPSEEVYSMGYPGITDLAEEDFARSNEIRKLLVENKATYRVHEQERQLRRPLSQTEVDAIVRDVAGRLGPIAGEWMEFLAHLGMFLQNADDGPAWDVTNVIAGKSLWGDYFKPTVTKGSIERIAKVRGFLGVDHPDVLTFQHSCAIKHGNSGGPLLNGGGQVVGVVGRGESKVSSGDREEIKWAAAAGELKAWLDEHHINYILAGEWHKEPEKIIQQLPATIIQQPTLKIVEQIPRKIILAISLAILVAMAAGVLAFIKSRRTPGVTTLLRDPRVARMLGSSPAHELRGGPAAPRVFEEARGNRGGWQLVGKTANGNRLQIDLSDSLFASNDYRLILGRTVELCHLVVDDDSVSKQHASIRKDGDRFLVADRNSSNHTAVNGKFNRQVFDETPLKEGDTLTLGEVRLQFRKL